MKNTTFLALLIPFAGHLACGSPDDSSPQTGGSSSGGHPSGSSGGLAHSGGGGSISSGGASLPSTGGITEGSGGAPGGGGSISSGGVPSSGGGAAASGGAPATGGSQSGGGPSSGGAFSGSGGASAGSGGGSAGSGGSSGDGGGSSEVDVQPSEGCGTAPTLTNTPGGMLNYNEITSGGAMRRYVLRLPTDYDSGHPYRLILGFHGATGNAAEVAGGGSPYFGLYDRAEGSTVFVAMEAVGGLWSADSDVTYVEDVLAELEADLCLDENRVELEGFSQGGAMTYTLLCARPGVFRAGVAHSPGGLAMPTQCDSVPYFTSLGQQENDRGQTMTADFFAEANGCNVETLPLAPSGGHLCSNYSGCSDGFPVRWCPYDGGHTPAPTDSGQQNSWMPDEVWAFLSEF